MPGRLRAFISDAREEGAFGLHSRWQLHTMEDGGGLPAVLHSVICRTLDPIEVDSS